MCHLSTLVYRQSQLFVASHLYIKKKGDRPNTEPFVSPVTIFCLEEVMLLIDTTTNHEMYCFHDLYMFHVGRLVSTTSGHFTGFFNNCRFTMLLPQKMPRSKKINNFFVPGQKHSCLESKDSQGILHHTFC